MSTPGRLITLEGGEGAGKSTHCRFIADWLQARGRQVTVTREPGGSPLAEAVRGIVLQDWAEGTTPETEVLLMFAARAAHWHATIAPALALGVDVVCDRFVDSSYAYQGGGRGLDPRHLQALEALVLGGARPDLTLLLDLEPQLGLARARQRGDANRFEAQNLAYMTRVREAFLARARAEPGRFAVIDAAQPLDRVRQALVRVLEERL